MDAMTTPTGQSAINPSSVQAGLSPQTSAPSKSFMTAPEWQQFRNDNLSHGIAAKDSYLSVKGRGIRIEGDPTPDYGIGTQSPSNSFSDNHPILSGIGN